MAEYNCQEYLFSFKLSLFHNFLFYKLLFVNSAHTTAIDNGTISQLELI